MRKYCDSLVKAGLKGVYEFPLVVTLAEISQDLNNDELKSVARELRAAAGREKFSVKKISFIDFPAGGDSTGVLFGHELDSQIPSKIFDSAGNKIKRKISPLVIGAFLDRRLTSGSKIAKEHCVSIKNIFEKNPPPQISFRAAAVANMYWQPFQIDESDIGTNDSKTGGEIQYKWMIGKLCWLPK